MKILSMLRDGPLLQSNLPFPLGSIMSRLREELRGSGWTIQGERVHTSCKWGDVVQMRWTLVRR